MGFVKTRRLAAMQKQQRAKAGTGSVANVGVLPMWWEGGLLELSGKGFR